MSYHRTLKPDKQRYNGPPPSPCDRSCAMRWSKRPVPCGECKLSQAGHGADGPELLSTYDARRMAQGLRTAGLLEAAERYESIAKSRRKV